MRLTKLKLKILISVCIACIFAVASTVGVRVLFPRKYHKEIASVCEQTNIPTDLVLAIVKAESSFDKYKVSPKGAIGLMQIMPETAEYVSELFFAGEDFDLYDEKQNILIGVTYLVYLFKKFEDKKTALAAYNAGEGRVYEWLKNQNYSSDGKALNTIPFKETDNYVKRVLSYQRFYNFIY